MAAAERAPLDWSQSHDLPDKRSVRVFQIPPTLNPFPGREIVTPLIAAVSSFVPSPDEGRTERGTTPMADIQFFPVPGGTFTVTAVEDNNGAPARVLEAALDFRVRGEITISAGNAITGTATVTIYADQLGGPIDQAIGSVPVNIPGDSPVGNPFTWTVTVAGGTLPNAPAGGSNLYRLAAVLTMVNSNNVLTETSAFVDLETFRIS
jgi:hypothetical protein